MSNFAWVTLTTNDAYSLGALVLAHSLKRVETAHQLAVLVTPTVSEAMRNRLREVYNVVQEVNVLDSHDTANLALLARPELGITFTKLHAWKLLQFEKCVFLDSDILVIQNADELFEREELSAAPDVSWPDCFNSGVFVYRPSEETFASLIQFALKNGSFDGGDQGLLNLYYSDWAHKDISKHLPFTYNTTAFASYSYVPAFKQFKDQVKILHFAGKLKPWLMNFNSETMSPYMPSEFQHASDIVQLWWTIFCEHVHKDLSSQMAGLAGALAQVRLGQPRSKEQEEYEAMMRRQCWESGNIDFSGRDSFDNIWKKISQTLEAKPTKAPGKSDENLTSADIEDGKIEYDPVTKIKTQYKVIEGGYEVIQTIPQQNGTNKTQVKTFYDPKPVTEEELRKQQQEKKVRQSKRNKNEVVQVDKNTTMITREIPGGYEEVYTTVYDDGSKSTRVKTFYDAVEVNDEDNDETTKKTTQQKKKTNKLNRNNTEEEENVNVTQKKTNKELVSTNQKNVRQVDDNEEYNVKHEQTVEETRRVTKKTEVSNKKTSVRTDSVQEENVKAVTNKDKKKKGKKAPPPPADFEQNDTTTVVSKNVPGGVEYTYTTTLESGKSITTSKTIYEEEETELTEEEIQMYKKQLKDAEKHKNVTTTKKLKSESGTKKIVPSENPGDVTTVETIKIEGGTEYHYTTVTAEGIVKKAVKTVYDPTPVNNPDDTDEEEYVEEYEEEIIEPGEKIVKTIETTKTLPQKYEEVVEKKTPKKKSSKLTRTNTEEEETRIVQKKNNEMMAINQQQSNIRQTQQEEHHTGTYSVRRESKVEETRTMTQKVKISGNY